MSVKALFFDVFGTLVDWRAGIAREAERILKPRGHALDWFAFADGFFSASAGLAEKAVWKADGKPLPVKFLPPLNAPTNVARAARGDKLPEPTWK